MIGRGVTRRDGDGTGTGRGRNRTGRGRGREKIKLYKRNYLHKNILRGGGG